MKIVKKNKVYFLNVSSSFEEDEISNFLDKPLICRKEDGLLVIKIDEKFENNSTLNDNKQITIKQKIISLLNDPKLNIQDKVEGNFEKLLNKDDLSIFKEMVLNKEIDLFKLSSKYKKGIYKVVNLNTDNKEYIKKETTNFKNNQFVKGDFSSFDKHKFIILKNSNDAKEFSTIYQDKIKSKEIIGIKSFDGNYYVVYRYLFLETKDAIFNLNIKGNFTINVLEEKLKLSKDLLKIIIEILKEEGMILEKTKNNYYFV